MIKNIYYIIENIKKLDSGKIKKYQISSELELEIICDYLKNNNILHTITIYHPKLILLNNNILYNNYKIKYDTYKTYFNNYVDDYEYRKIKNNYKLYIIVYKDFVNLCDKIKYTIDKSKFKIYIY